MTTFKSHFCQEREEREILRSVFARFCRFAKWAFNRKSTISTGRNGRLKPGKLLDLIDISGINKTVFNFVALIFREQDFSNAGRFY